MLAVFISGTQMKTKATMHLRDIKGKIDARRQQKINPLLFQKQSYLRKEDIKKDNRD